jgi:dTDP-4-dehydrorhamnose reductase
MADLDRLRTGSDLRCGLALELWGGHECTVNRVRDAYIDQTKLSGHQDRIEDLALFADLGVKALRYPVLWERIAPETPGERDWGWTDARLGEIRRLGMRPIAGLLHHGSGPVYTNLIADNFVEGLADFAQAAAERYPWIEDWTPVNEPLTTARFSALYGHWYPHAQDERLFWTAFLNQIDAVREAMRRIRQVNPAARLVQTEDLGQTYATPPLAEQAAFDNHRRWLTWDLLTGSVDREHPLWARFKRFGLTDRLQAMADAPCPPDVVGVNHYLTSERFLDHRVERYPAHRRGGNDYVAYADVEAVRVMSPGPVGLAGLMEQAWDRYALPMAITEAHNGCTREEQMRWTVEAWRAAERLRDRGADVRAVTSWALLGAYDWDSLLTVQAGRYEPGAFDLRGGPGQSRPQPNAMTRMLADLAAGKPLHPVAGGQGWWRRDVRLEFQPVGNLAGLPVQRHYDPEPAASAPILIAGATGMLGQALARTCRLRGLSYVLTDRRQMPLGDPDAIARTLERHRPWAVINAAGWVRVDDAEADVDACRAANFTGAVNLALAAAAIDAHYTTFSSDLVFGGQLDRPYVESDCPRPLNVYGASKLAAERGVLGLDGEALVVRTAAFFSPDDPHNFAALVARRLGAGRSLQAAADVIITPTYVPDLCHAVLDLAIDREAGLWHLSNGEAMSSAAFGMAIADALDLDRRLIKPVAADQMGWAAHRPARVVLGTERGLRLPSLDKAIAQYATVVREHQVTPAPALAPEGDQADWVA